MTMSDYAVEIIQTRQALKCWNVYGPMLNKAVGMIDDGYELRDLKRDVKEGRAMVVGVYEKGGRLQAVATIKRFILGKQNLLDVTNIQGSGWDKWGGDLLAWLEEEAARKGADGITATGRVGWIRKLRPHGYAHLKTMLVKELRHA